MEMAQALTIFAIVAANIGTVIALYIQQDGKLEAHRKETMEIIKAIQIEIKDFHGRLCTIEERGKK